MRWTSLWGGALMLIGPVALAASGDALVVTGDHVNVRTGPDTDASVQFQVNHDQAAVELARRGPWVQVRLPDRDASGWIHQSLLEPAEPEPAAAPPAAEPAPGASTVPRPAPPDIATSDAGDSQGIKQFRTTVQYLNDRAVAAAGVDLFTDVKPLGDGTVQVTATDAWSEMPEGGRRSYLNTLFDRWQVAEAGQGSLKVQVVDPSGKVVMEKAGP